MVSPSNQYLHVGNTLIVEKNKNEVTCSRENIEQIICHKRSSAVKKILGIQIFQEIIAN